MDVIHNQHHACRGTKRHDSICKHLESGLDNTQDPFITTNRLSPTTTYMPFPFRDCHSHCEQATDSYGTDMANPLCGCDHFLQRGPARCEQIKGCPLASHPIPAVILPTPRFTTGPSAAALCLPPSRHSRKNGQCFNLQQIWSLQSSWYQMSCKWRLISFLFRTEAVAMRWIGKFDGRLWKALQFGSRFAMGRIGVWCCGYVHRVPRAIMQPTTE